MEFDPMAALREALSRPRQGGPGCPTLGNHTYQVVGKMMPTEVRCSVCGRTWVVGDVKAVG